MKILCASNSFKDCCSAKDASQWIQDGFNYIGFLDTTICPLADGGDGTLDIISSIIGLNKIQLQVFNPLYIKIDSYYYISTCKTVAYIEMSNCSGIKLLNLEDRNAANTSTYGVGQMIKNAIENFSIKTIVVMLGGSATIDGGVGMAAALGFKFIDKNGNLIINPVGSDLINIKKIIPSAFILDKVDFIGISDVNTKLIGIDGCVELFSLQKGVQAKFKPLFEDGLKNLSELFQYDLNLPDLSLIESGGAAGGLGAGLVAFCSARLDNGFDYISRLSNLEFLIKESNIVITGEGQIDSTTSFGKVPFGVALLCKKYKKPCIVLCGKINHDEVNTMYEEGITSIFSICSGPMSLEYSITNVKFLITSLSKSIARIYKNNKHQDNN